MGTTKMDKRRVTVKIAGQTCSFYSDDSDAYLEELARKANEIMAQTAKIPGPSAIMAVILLTDELMRREQKPKQPEVKKIRKKEENQVSMWDLMDGVV